MKRITLVIIIAFSYFYSNAQDWAPAGTKWYYSDISWGFPFTNTPRIFESTGDTIINTKTCRIISGSCMCGFSLNDNYMYYENEKIYLYVDSATGFHTLYDFAAKAGDSWPIIIPYNNINDTSEIYVDSVKTINVAGDTFSIQYVHTIGYNEIWGFYGEIIKDIGNTFCLLPQHATCDPWTTNLRCFETPAETINFGTINCNDTVCFYSTDEKSQTNNIAIFPNPASTHLTLETPQQSTIQILTLQGQLIKTINATQPTTTLDISNLARGMYFVKVMNEKGVASGKFVKE